LLYTKITPTILKKFVKYDYNFVIPPLIYTSKRNILTKNWGGKKEKEKEKENENEKGKAIY
jgi:hypothetical protein